MKNLSVSDYPIDDFKTARDWHIYHVYNDPEFINELERLPEENTAAYNEALGLLARKYAIAAGDVRLFLLRKLLPGIKNTTKNSEMSFDIEDNKLVLKFGPAMTRQEFMERWREFASFRRAMKAEAKTRSKPPLETKLIYAIFRARQTHTFKEIFELYSQGRLPLYTGSSSQFRSEDSLESYYQKYRPDKTKAIT